MLVTCQSFNVRDDRTVSLAIEGTMPLASESVMLPIDTSEMNDF